MQQHVAAQWGAAERDPFFHPSRLTCGDFAIPGFRTGNIAVLVQPARGYNLDPKATYHDPALPPPHSYLATYAFGTGEACLGASNVAAMQSGTLGIADEFARLAAEPHFTQRSSQ